MLLSCTCSLLLANNINLNVSIDKRSMTLDETLTYEVKLSGIKASSKPDIILPDFSQHFVTLSSSQQSYISIINGKTSHAKSYQFTLKPFQSGQAVIQAAKVKYKGQLYQSESLSVHIDANPNQNSNSNNPTGTTQRTTPAENKNSQIQNAAKRFKLFAQALTDKQEAYIGEQIIYKVKFYRRVRLFSNISFSVPVFNQFWTENLNVTPQDTPTKINNVLFYERDIAHKAIFGLKAGTYTISGPQIAFILNPFDGQSSIQANPITLSIKALPEENKPPNFSGLIGSYTLKQEKKIQEGMVQTPISLKFTLTGDGNINSINQLNFTESPLLKIYKSGIQNTFQRDTKLSGSRTFEYIIMPKQAGKIQIPDFTCNYFSPSDKSYKTLKVPGYTLDVKTNPNINEDDIDNPAPTIQTQKIKLKKQISPLKSPISLTPKTWLWEKPISKIFLWANIAILLFLGLWQLIKNINYQRQVHQNQKEQLLELKKRIERAPLSLETLHLTFLDLLCIFIGPKAKSQDKKQILKTLAHTLDSETQEQISQLWDHLNYNKYAATPPSQDTLITLRNQLIINIKGLI
eukprot:COSAG01_NODE_7_length_54400_cov_1218.054935_34_plen_575_part_00